MVQCVCTLDNIPQSILVTVSFTSDLHCALILDKTRAQTIFLTYYKQAISLINNNTLGAKKWTVLKVKILLFDNRKEFCITMFNYLF